MEEKYIKVVEKSYASLVKCITDLPSLLDQLIAKGTLTKPVVEIIKVNDTRSEKIRKLLDILQRQPQQAFDEFYFSLKESGEKSAKSILDKNLAQEGLPIPRKPDPCSGKPGNEPAAQVATKHPTQETTFSDSPTTSKDVAEDVAEPFENLCVSDVTDDAAGVTGANQVLTDYEKTVLRNMVYSLKLK